MSTPSSELKSKSTKGPAWSRYQAKPRKPQSLQKGRMFLSESFFARFRALHAVTITTTVSWDVMCCSLEVSKEIAASIFYSWSWLQHVPSDTWVTIHQAARRYVQEDSIFHIVGLRNFGCPDFGNPGPIVCIGKERRFRKAASIYVF